MNREQLGYIPPEAQKLKEQTPSVNELKESFEKTNTGLEKSRTLLRAAQGQGGDKETMEWLAKRLNRGESLDDIARKTAANIAGQREGVFKKELAYLKARLPQLEQGLDPELAAIIKRPDGWALLIKLRDVLEFKMRGQAPPNPKGNAGRIDDDKGFKKKMAIFKLAKDLLEAKRKKGEGLDEIGRKISAAEEVAQTRARIEEIKKKLAEIKQQKGNQ